MCKMISVSSEYHYSTLRNFNNFSALSYNDISINLNDFTDLSYLSSIFSATSVSLITSVNLIPTMTFPNLSDFTDLSYFSSVFSAPSVSSITSITSIPSAILKC